MKLLVVDDDEVDTEAIERAVSRSSLPVELHSAGDGHEALRILRGNGEEPLRRPYIVLLDLNMPGMDGFGFLEELRGDDRCKDTVVFVLSTSNSHLDQARAYNFQVAGYVVKSRVAPRYERLIDLIRNYIDVVSLPKTTPSPN